MSKLSFLNYQIKVESDLIYDYSMFGIGIEEKQHVIDLCCRKSNNSDMFARPDMYVIHQRIIYRKYQVYQSDTGIFEICFGTCMATGDDDMFDPGTEFKTVNVKTDAAIEVLERWLAAYERDELRDDRLYMPHVFKLKDTYKMPVSLINRLERELENVG